MPLFCLRVSLLKIKCIFQQKSPSFCHFCAPGANIFRSQNIWIYPSPPTPLQSIPLWPVGLNPPPHHRAPSNTYICTAYICKYYLIISSVWCFGKKIATVSCVYDIKRFYKAFKTGPDTDNTLYVQYVHYDGIFFKYIKATVLWQNAILEMRAITQ